MGKIILLLLLLIAALTSSCNKTKVYPIERYKGSIIARMDYKTSFYPELELKSKDSIYWVTVTKYDSDMYNVGDTIK